jgi:hypothetical protein
MVQRYQAQGLVKPTVESLSGGSTLDDIYSGYKRILGTGANQILDPFGAARMLDRYFPDYFNTPAELVGYDPVSLEKEKQARVAEKLGEYNTMNRLDTEAGLRRLASPQAQTSPEEMAESERLKKQYQQYADSMQNVQPTPQPGETEDEFRARYAELLATQEPSDWEKAQRWFAMSEQFLDPSKTTMQSIAGAGRAFSEASAEQERARRDAELALKKALLEYDIGKAQSRSEAEAEAAKDQREFERKMKERGTPSADAAVSALTRSMMDIDDQIQKLSVGLMPGEPPPPENQAQIERLLKVRKGLNEQLINIMDRGGFINRKIITDEDLAALGI